MSGYIKLHRKIKECGFYNKSDEKSIFIHLLLEANYMAKEVKIDGRKVLVEAGSFLTSRDKISKELKIEATKIYRVLKKFESDGIIEQIKTNRYTLIKIINWETYQGSDDNVHAKCTATVSESPQLITQANEKQNAQVINSCKPHLVLNQDYEPIKIAQVSETENAQQNARKVHSQKNKTAHNIRNIKNNNIYITPHSVPPLDQKNQAGRLGKDVELLEIWESYAKDQGISNIKTEFEKFKNHWLSVPGKAGIKQDWFPVWKNWVLRAKEFQQEKKDTELS
jgi:predicted transcriptional regulator